MDDLYDRMIEKDSLVHRAVDATRRYHDARDSGAAAEEVERLRLEAEWMFQSASDYMRRETSGSEQTLQ